MLKEGLTNPARNLPEKPYKPIYTVGIASTSLQRLLGLIKFAKSPPRYIKVESCVSFNSYKPGEGFEPP